MWEIITMSAIVQICKQNYQIETTQPLYFSEIGEQPFPTNLLLGSTDTAINFAKSLKNEQSVIYGNNNWLFAYVDRIRTYPLFYTINNDMLLISDSAAWIKEKLINVKLSRTSALEFYQSGFVIGKHTLYKKIKTLEAGTCLIAERKNNKWQIQIKEYCQYFINQPDKKTSLDILSKRLHSKLEFIFTNLIANNKNKTFVIPLSGGLDSRLIVSWLHRLNYKNVICYSFGTPGNKDCRKAKNIADKLNYKWFFVNLSRKEWLRAYYSKSYKEYQSHYSGYCSLLSSQEFPAFYYMVRHKYLPENSIVIPGHTGDFISGGHIPNNIFQLPIGKDTVVNYILKKHFSLWDTIWSNHQKSNLELLKSKVISHISHYQCDSYESMASAIEWFDWKERQAKFIVQFVNVYKHFNVPFLLPLWSTSLMDFFLDIPFEFRFSKKLYINYLYNYDHIDLYNDLEPQVQNQDCHNKQKKTMAGIIKQKFYNEWYYKYFWAYFANELNYFAPFSFLRFLGSFGHYRNPNSFFAQDYLQHIKSCQSSHES